MILNAVKAVLGLRERRPVRYFAYNDLGENGEPIVTIVTDQQILKEYWEYWCRSMEEKKGLTVEEFRALNQDDCIEDWINIHWAWQVDENGKTLEPGL